MLEMIKKYNTVSASDDFATTEKVIHFKHGIPDCEQTVINQNTVEEEKEEEIEEEVYKDVCIYMYVCICICIILIIIYFVQLKELTRNYSMVNVLRRTLVLNKSELIFIAMGFFFAIISGLIFPSFAVFLGELLDVSSYKFAYTRNLILHRQFNNL